MNFEQQKEGFVQWGKGVTAAIYNGKITALNEASNEFIFFDDIQSSLLFSILGAPSSKLSEDEVGSLNDLVSQGLIRLGEKLPKQFFQDEKISKGAFECDWALGKSRVDLSNFRPKYFIRAMIFLSSAKKNSDKGKLHIILQDLRRFPPDSMAADEAELHKIASNVNLAVFCLWRKVKCLEFAYAVARIAFSHNVKCKFIVGVQTHPFISHAWVEGESGVVYDRKELPMELAKIVSIGGSGNA